MMKKKKFLLFYVLFVLCLPISAISVSEPEQEVECDWQLQLEKEGVKSFFRCKEDSPLDEYRSVAVLDFPIEVLLEVVTDVPSYPKWMPDVVEAIILKEFNNGMERGNFYIHVKFDSQWPVNDRDVVIETTPKTDWNNGVSVVKLKKLNDYPLSSEEGVVRIKDFESEFKFEYLERNKTKVTFTTFVDLGGIISPKLSKVQTEKIPYGTLEGMARVAKDTKYFEAAVRDYY